METLEKQLEALDVKYAGDIYQAQRARQSRRSWAPHDLVERDYRADLVKAKEERRKARVNAIEAHRRNVSPYLLRRLRTIAEAMRDIHASRN